MRIVPLGLLVITAFQESWFCSPMCLSLSGFQVPIAKLAQSQGKKRGGGQSSCTSLRTLKVMLDKRHWIVVILGAHLLHAR